MGLEGFLAMLLPLMLWPVAAVLVVVLVLLLAPRDQLAAVLRAAAEVITAARGRGRRRSR